MQATRTVQQAYAEDIFYGQIVTIWARWFLILAGAVLVLFSNDNSSDLVKAILPVVALVIMNFYLHGRYMIEKPANQALLFLTGLLDIAIVTLLVGVWQPVGLKSWFFTFYYPVLIAAAFVFPQRTTLLLTLVALVAYTAVCVVTTPDLLSITEWQKVLIQRLITLGSMGVLGTFYWRIMRSRRAMQEKSAQ